jgi:uncharacterized FlgJ-related protein
MKNTYYKLTEDLKLKKVPNLGRVTKTSLLLNIALLIIIIVLVTKDPIIRKIHTHTRDTVTVGDVALTDSAILKELVNQDCVLPPMAVAQARIETGNYVSKVCLSNKNLFGIKYHKCQYVLGELNNHASYKSYKDNIKCYIHIQNRYLRNIDGRYAEAGNYVSVLKGLGK